MSISGDREFAQPGLSKLTKFWETGLDACSLNLEITGVIMENTEASILQQLKALAVQLH